MPGPRSDPAPRQSQKSDLRPPSRQSAALPGGLLAALAGGLAERSTAHFRAGSRGGRRLRRRPPAAPAHCAVGRTRDIPSSPGQPPRIKGPVCTRSAAAAGPPATDHDADGWRRSAGRRPPAAPAAGAGRRESCLTKQLGQATRQAARLLRASPPSANSAIMIHSFEDRDMERGREGEREREGGRGREREGEGGREKERVREREMAREGERWRERHPTQIHCSTG